MFTVDVVGLPGSGRAQRELARAGLRGDRRRAGRAVRRCRPAAPAAGNFVASSPRWPPSWASCWCISEVINKPSGTTVDWGLYLSSRSRCCRRSPRSAPAVRLRRHHPAGAAAQVRAASSTAGTAARRSTTASTGQPQPHQGGRQQQRPGYPSPVRRLPGRTSQSGGFPRDRPAERPADPSDRLPDLRPAADASSTPTARRPRSTQSSPSSASRADVVVS